MVALLVTLIAGLRGLRRTKDGNPLLFVGGWGLGSLALISPLCALSVSLFTARVGQHMILALIVAPLIALALPAPRHPGRAPLAAAAFAVTLWVWHAPGPYAATFRSDVIYWTMHLTMFGTALWFWQTTLRAPADRLGATTAAMLFTGVQMALLGAVIAFARVPLYAPHWLTTLGWGLSPLGDQQLGGAVMWLPGGIIVAAAILAPLAYVLRQPGARTT